MTFSWDLMFSSGNVNRRLKWWSLRILHTFWDSWVLLLSVTWINNALVSSPEFAHLAKKTHPCRSHFWLLDCGISECWDVDFIACYFRWMYYIGDYPAPLTTEGTNSQDSFQKTNCLQWTRLLHKQAQGMEPNTCTNTYKTARVSPLQMCQSRMIHSRWTNSQTEL